MQNHMMKVLVKGHSFHYEVENLCRIFFPNAKISVVHDDGEQPFDVETILVKEENRILVQVKATFDASTCEREAELPYNGDDLPEESELALVRLLFSCLTTLTGYKPKWGILTGVRPSKLMYRLIEEMGEQKAREKFQNDFHVTRKKTDLTLDVVRAETPIIQKSKPESFSLYIAIPFCPSRCSYCSFVSHSIKQAKKLLPNYLNALVQEIEKAGAVAKQLGLRLETVYFGGGTPTILEAGELATLGRAIDVNFDLSTVCEYTVEAGRPDTITREKLLALKEMGASRISINPQTFIPQVLEEIGREHSVKQIYTAFNLAREIGFDNINMDLIAGLPSDTLDGFKHSVLETLSLSPEGVTVHTLAHKRSSDLVQGGAFIDGEQTINAMLDFVKGNLRERYIPYYMYRQSKSLGNLENVGWSKKGRECLYNIYMMEETHTVIGCGAGAVTKLRDPHSEKIERVFNFKYPYEYIDRFSEMIERKDKIVEFYKKYSV